MSEGESTADKKLVYGLDLPKEERQKITKWVGMGQGWLRHTDRSPYPIRVSPKLFTEHQFWVDLDGHATADLPVPATEEQIRKLPDAGKNRALLLAMADVVFAMMEKPPTYADNVEVAYAQRRYSAFQKALAELG